MSAIIFRLLRRLTIAERTALIVGGLTITAMLSAVALDRLLAQPPSPVVVTLHSPEPAPPVVASSHSQ